MVQVETYIGFQNNTYVTVMLSWIHKEKKCHVENSSSLITQQIIRIYSYVHRTYVDYQDLLACLLLMAPASSCMDGGCTEVSYRRKHKPALYPAVTAADRIAHRSDQRPCFNEVDGHEAVLSRFRGRCF